MTSSPNVCSAAASRSRMRRRMAIITPAMTKKADAFAQYNDAAVLQMLIQVLPDVAEKLASPMGAIDQLTVISTDGASALPRQVTSNFTQLQQLLKDTVGIDLAGIVNSRAGTAPDSGSADSAS